MEMTEGILIAVSTGAASSLITVVAMRTDVTWLKQGLAELKQSVHRAHQRIDILEKEMIHNKTPH